MARSAAFAALTLVGLLLWPAAAAAQTTVEGRTAGGAYYRIVVPAVWNGDLVIWNHGLEMTPPAAGVDLGPLADLQAAQGFAVAASSYRQAGWALFKSVADLNALARVFEGRFGKPGRVVLAGGSLGGLVTAQLLEKAKLGNVVGALIMCAPVAGSRNWDAALDLRLAYDAACRDVPGAAIAGGAAGLPSGATLTDSELRESVNACTGVDKKPARRSAAEKRRLRRLLAAVGLRADFLQLDMWYATRVMADLVHDRGKLKGKLAVGNVGVTYGDATIDAVIERVSPKAGPARRLAKHFTPRGAIGSARVVALHTDKDDLVVVENLSDYGARVSATQIVTAVAVEKKPSHCGLSPAETVAGWEELLAWVNGGPQPSAADIQAQCQAIARLGFVAGDCRFDPGYRIGDLDDRIPPR